MRPLAAALAAVACAAFPLALATMPVGAAAMAEYDAIRAARPDGRSITVNNLTIERDAFRIELRAGTVHFLAPVGNETFGAVFIGDGAYHLKPATANEQQHLRFVTNTPQLDELTDRFDHLVLFFTDKTAAEIIRQASPAIGAPNPEAVRVYEDYLKHQQRDVQINLHMRVLGDLLNRPSRPDGAFLASVDGRTYGKALMVVDPLGISNLSPQFGDLGGEEVAFISLGDRNGGFWYLSAFAKDAINGHGKPVRPLADTAKYEVDTTIDGRAIRGRTVITFTPLSGGVRLLPVNIAPMLTINSAVLETERGAIPLGIVRDELQQNSYPHISIAVADADVALLFPQPLAATTPVRVRLEYEGRDVLDGYDGRYSVRARESWYPNLGTFVDLADYELRFHFPKKNTLVSVGTLVSEQVEGDQKISLWRSDQPMRVAGFNYGEFNKLTSTDPETGLAIGVYTNKDWSTQAKVALADAINATRVGNAFFGKPPFAHLSMTQQLESNFGQSWPTLVFLPTVALTTSMQRAMADNIDPRNMQSLQEFVNIVGWHEVSHQWWGHQVGWQSYRDQWLSEGFAEFTAALMLEFAESRKSYDKFWALRRTEILDRQGNLATYDAGPITQGFRLATERSPRAVNAVMYGKGGYVLHMLRMQMRQENNRADPDVAFRAMMKDFVASWAGKNPSTQDFQHVAERHMLPVMDVMKNQRLDYFFDQWVHGTEIPQLTSALQLADLGGGRYRISGTVTQAGVSAGFHTLVPVYLDFGDDRLQKLGEVHLAGAFTQNVTVELPLPQKPRRVVINARNDILTRANSPATVR